MTPLDISVIPQVVSVLNRYGVNVTVKKVVGVYDPATGQTTQTPTEYAGKMTPPMPYENKLVNGTSILNTDLRGFIGPKTSDGSDIPEVKPPWTVVYNGQTFTVVSCRVIRTGDCVALYEVQLR